MSAAKNWCFTLNNYTDVEIVKLDTMFDHGHFNYIVYGKEVGSEENTPHLQGYVQLKKKLRLNQVKQLISPRAHLEISRGSPELASRYCKTRVEDDFIEQVKKKMILLKRVKLPT